MDCAAWNSLGQQLSATPGTPGAPAGSWSSWYQARGYGCTIAKDGPLESAREEARKAHNRGCDVLLHYIPDGGGQSHIEMVAGFPPDTLGESVSTLSWGTVANVTVIFGRFFSKTDAGRYGANSFLSRSGSAVFYYYCPR